MKTNEFGMGIWNNGSETKGFDDIVMKKMASKQFTIHFDRSGRFEFRIEVIAMKFLEHLEAKMSFLLIFRKFKICEDEGEDHDNGRR